MLDFDHNFEPTGYIQKKNGRWQKRVPTMRRIADKFPLLIIATGVAVMFAAMFLKSIIGFYLVR